MVSFERNLDILVLVYEFLHERTNGGQKYVCTSPEKSIPPPSDDGTVVHRSLMLQSVGIVLLLVRNNAGRTFPDGLNLTSVT